jgi:Lar family restriction alleviation protein
MMRNLAPDSFDINLILEGNLQGCPFCGDRLAAIINRVNDETTIYRSLISCSDCGAQVGYNDRDLDQARKGAIDRWNKRAAR